MTKHAVIAAVGPEVVMSLIEGLEKVENGELIMKATLYTRPNGNKKEIDILNINPEDSEYFESSDFHVSLEYTGQQVILYADCGFKTEDGEPDEVIYISIMPESCESAMKKLKCLCIEQINEKGMK